MNALTDKSTTVTGTVTTLDGLTGAEKPLAGAYVRVSGHVNNKNSNAIWTNGTTPTYTAAQVNADQPIAPATIVSPVANNPSLGTQYTANFNAVSGTDGRFTINTAGNAPLMASNPSDTANASPTTNGRIQAYAFKNGNDSSTNTPVTDATPPVVTPYGSSEARSAVAAASAPLSAASFIKRQRISSVQRAPIFGIRRLLISMTTVKMRLICGPLPALTNRYILLLRMIRVIRPRYSVMSISIRRQMPFLLANQQSS
ncbi:hypothetical protein [Schleiferilactobacillus harbinensis]|uniref:Uncharacterized protein n=1 Tax=Schleiferilactobacillus harbinensis TaxID=304207 RepID=A0A5P8M8E8_9LACO|nr:hypothetical protein [Schleiferilactobacillus harbinensis]QFR24812.1 hypothetical protein D1010_16300 [Schleiferilactobacillus harbinensis]